MVNSDTFPKVFAHRGASGYAPENTLPAMRKAKQLGASWVEFDVRLTSDNVAIIFHDASLDRTTNGRGLVVDTPYSDIKQLDAGSWFAAEFAGAKVPSFVDILQYNSDLNLSMNVEIKPNTGQDTETAAVVMDVLKQHWPNTDHPPLISSFSIESLREVRRISKTIPMALLLKNWLPNWQELAKEFNCSSVNLHHEILTTEIVAEIHKLGYQVCAYTVDDANLARKYYAMGTDALFSNYPDRMLALFD